MADTATSMTSSGSMFGGMGSMFGGIGSLLGGIGSFMSGQAMAGGYEEMEKYYKEAARVSLLSGKIKGNLIQRQIWQTGGTAAANVGAGNIAMTGSAKDAIAANAQQGYLTKAVNVMNYNLEYKSYMAQAAMAEAQANAAEAGGMMGLLGGILGMFSDDRLKSDIEFVGRRGDSIGVYRFNYKGQEGRWEGVMADEIELLRPEVVHKVEGGYRLIDYDALGIEFKRID